MPAPASPPLEVTFPHTFLADLAYRIGSALFSGIGIIGLGVAFTHHRTHDLLVLAIPFVLFFAVLLVVTTFSLTADETGLHQRSVLGRKDTRWEDIDRLDQGQAYSVYRNGKEPVRLALVSTKAQEALALEIIRRAALHPSGAKMQHPLKRQWVR